VPSFEKLVIQYLVLDPVYGRLFEHRWLWKDWPGRAGNTDTGIDLWLRKPTLVI
jgi:predicted helicase